MALIDTENKYRVELLTPLNVFRGDTFSIPVKINTGTNIEPVYYEMTENSYLYVGVTEPHQKFENAIIRKKYTKESQIADNVIPVSLLPEDTICLEEGVYYIEMKLLILSTSFTKLTDIDPKLLFELDPLTLSKLEETNQGIIRTVLPKRLLYIIN